MIKCKIGFLENHARGLQRLCHRKSESGLAMKLRRIRRAILIAMSEDQEAERQSLLDRFCEKDAEGLRVTKVKLENDGVTPCVGDDGKDILQVVLADEEGYGEAHLALLNTELEFAEHLAPDDFQDFVLSSDELDALGPFFVDPDEPTPKTAEAFTKADQEA